MIEGSNFAE